MHSIQHIRRFLLAAVMVMLLVGPSSVLRAQSFAAEDTQIFIAGFNAFQKQDYRTAAERMEQVLRQYPNSQLYDTALFWLARAHFKLGNREEAGRYMAQFLRQYPNSPLKSSVEEELAALAKGYTGPSTVAAVAPPAETPPLPAVSSPEQHAAPKELVAAVAPSSPPVPSAAPQTAVAVPPASVPVPVETAPVVAVAEPAAPAVELPKPPAENPASETALQPRSPETHIAAAPAAKQRPEASTRKARAAARAEVAKAAKAAKLREKAIAEYRRVIARHPDSAAAVTAAAKLRELGVDVPLATTTTAVVQPAAAAAPGAQVLTFQIAQYARGDLTVEQKPVLRSVGEPSTIGFTVINEGNGTDSFNLETGFPAEFAPRFAALGQENQPIVATPSLAPGEKFQGTLTLTPPPSLVDGQTSRYPVKIISSLNRQFSVTKEVNLVASAPLLRAVVASDKIELSPGERINYRVSLLNIGSAAARNVRLGIVCPPHFDLVEMKGASLQSGEKSELVADGLQIASGENREFMVSFQLKDDAPARQELFCRADVTNAELKSHDSFLSQLAVVRTVSGVAVAGKSGTQTAVPGQSISVPLVVTNRGNLRDTFSLKASLPDGVTGTYYLDQNRDGIHQGGEPAIAQIGPLNPREEASLILQLQTPVAALDRSELTVGTAVESGTDRSKKASSMVRILFSRPAVELRISSPQGNMLPGDVSAMTMLCVNSGSSLARTLEVRTILPAQMEVVSADPLPSASQDGTVIWRFNELGSGEQRPVRMVFRIRPGVPAGTGVQVQNFLTYEDHLGNRY